MNESKEAFFAQYWGQRRFVFTENNNNSVQKIGATYFGKRCINDRSIKLKNLINITDAQAHRVGSLLDLPSPRANNGRLFVLKLRSNLLFPEKLSPFAVLEAIQYLQSEGYAVPFRGLTVDKMIEKKWIIEE